ncbi:MAG TPA: serine protease [Solirubrobacterales bacterium]|jgi:secreted trypsin-like serine protease|nr:serine protease [Solirubrobacterales bacterium]
MRRWKSPRLRQLLASALAATSLALLTPGLAQAANAQTSIIRGDVASTAEFPSLAFIAASTGKNEGFACTGTVLSPRVILTAAHCVEDLDVGGFTAPTAYKVATGRTAPTEEDEVGNVLPVSSTHVFPGFDPGTVLGDAALLILASPTTAPAISLAGAADAALYAGGAPVRLAGWGLTAPRAKSIPKSLHATSTVVLSPASCKKRTRSFSPTYSGAMQMCTTDPPDHANGGCFGDSGGPAIAQRADGTPVQIGIVSVGGPECSTKLPNIFTRVDLVSTWASEWVAATETGTPPPSLKAQLPAMSTESAQGLVGGVLNTRLGESFAGSRGLEGECRRLGRAKQKCELLWRYKSKLYFATVTVFYVLQQNAVAWDNSFMVSRASIRCLNSNHSDSCPVETQRG